MAANLLRWRGFAVIELGADTPADAIAQTAAAESDLVAVGIACTTKSSPLAARKVIAALRLAVVKVPIIVGGAAIVDDAQAKRLGADFFTGGNGGELVRVVEAIADKRP